MSTYLQGVTDYIPQFQPFQPDLNFYANALQTKQNQYDTTIENNFCLTKTCLRLKFRQHKNNMPLGTDTLLACF